HPLREKLQLPFQLRHGASPPRARPQVRQRHRVIVFRPSLFLYNIATYQSREVSINFNYPSRANDDITMRAWSREINDVYLSVRRSFSKPCLFCTRSINNHFAQLLSVDSGETERSFEPASSML